ncbi:hypothetical protein BD413DRAFT_515494 [Trametes elegans]|nr:hypothetical protein BD413DRAFT_515494 [Trametes elegans]
MSSSDRCMGEGLQKILLPGWTASSLRADPSEDVYIAPRIPGEMLPATLALETSFDSWASGHSEYSFNDLVILAGAVACFHSKSGFKHESSRGLVSRSVVNGVQNSRTVYLGGRTVVTRRRHVQRGRLHCPDTDFREESDNGEQWQPTCGSGMMVVSQRW